MKTILEVCCGGYYDAVQAAKGGAARIELNSALHLGGLTPSIAALDLIKEKLDLKVIVMVRPRGAGFCYNESDYEVMLRECNLFLEHGADGIAFGFLKNDRTIDVQRTEQFVEIIRKKGKEAVFHRAFDCIADTEKAVNILISSGINRILTSGGKKYAMDGIQTIAHLQKKYGSKIELIAGSGINEKNAKLILQKTGIHQIHSSCKIWLPDETTSSEQVDYRYGHGEYAECYDVVSAEKVRKIIDHIKCL